MLDFRFANEKDVDLIFDFINELAIYEKLENQVTATKEKLKKWIFDYKSANVIFIMFDNKEVGFALFFYNFSTFKGQRGLYLEDLYIRPEYRNKGYGKETFKKLANIALENECQRMEWVCLNWNVNSIEFYKKMGACSLDDWKTYRLNREDIENLVK